MTPRKGLAAIIARRAMTSRAMAMTATTALMTDIIAATIIATSGAIAMSGATRSAGCTIIIAVATGVVKLDRILAEGSFRCDPIEIEPVGVAMIIPARATLSPTDKSTSILKR